MLGKLLILYGNQSWDEHLNEVLHFYNTTYHSTLHETPAEAWARSHVIPKDDSEEMKKKAMVESAVHIKWLVENATKAALRNKKRREKKKNRVIIEVNDYVFVRQPLKDKSVKPSNIKLKALYPWFARVLKNLRNGRYMVQFIESVDGTEFPDEKKSYHVKFFAKGENTHSSCITLNSK
jgi:hypothetical protein